MSSEATHRKHRIAIIGAGPIGLEAGLYAALAGLDVEIYERSSVAEHVSQWGHLRLFSPFALNASEWGRGALVRHDAAHQFPGEDELLSGREYAERYLLPLSRLPELNNRVHEHLEVRAIGRCETWKGDLIGSPKRADDPFQLLLSDGREEKTVEADYVLDCSGTYGSHNWIGAGGMPCIGETTALTDADYRLPDILGADRPHFANQKILVVGCGYSAATAIVSLAELAIENPETQVIWLTRSDRTPPMTRIDDDSLPERDRLSNAANQLALSVDNSIDWHPQSLVRSIQRDNERGVYRVEVAGQGGALETLVVDRIVVNVGYRPDRSLYEELQVHECYATQGPMKLAAALLGETSQDCLLQESHGAETLKNPEPRFFILGAKSYGRDSRFLIKIGLQQITDLFTMLGFQQKKAQTERVA